MYLSHSFHEVWHQPAPHLLVGPADHQDVFRYWVMGLTSWTDVWLVKVGPLIGEEVTRQKLEVQPESLEILGGDDVVETGVRCTCQALQLNMQVLYLRI